MAKARGFSAFIRYACKMATGTGKTTVMGMLSAWSILNRIAAPTDDRFSDTVLIVCPHVTIRERLQELDPARGDLSLYRTRQLVPPQRMEDLRRGEVMIANWHRLAKLETNSVNGQFAKVVKTGEPIEVVKNAGKANETIEAKFFESDAAWFKRIHQGLGSGRGRSPHWLVFNDEAHHAYRRGGGGLFQCLALDATEGRQSAVSVLLEAVRKGGTLSTWELPVIPQGASGRGIAPFTWISTPPSRSIRWRNAT